MKKLLSTLALAPMALTACGGGTADSSPTVKVLSGKENTIVFGTTKSEGREHWNKMQSIVEDYNAKREAGTRAVELQFFAPGNAGKAAIAGGQVPDIVEVYNDELSKIYEDNNKNIIDLGTTDIDATTFVDSFVEEGKAVGGKLYNLPYLKSLQVQAVNRKLMNEFIAWNGGTECLDKDYNDASCTTLGVSATAFKGKSSFTKDNTINWDAFTDSDPVKYKKLLDAYADATDHTAYATTPVIDSGFTYSEKFQVADKANPTAAEFDAALAAIKAKGKVGSVDYGTFVYSTAADTTVVWASSTPTSAELAANPFSARIKVSSAPDVFEYRAATKNNVLSTYSTYETVSVNGATSRSGQMIALGSDSLSNDVMLAAADKGASGANYDWNNFFYNANGNYDNFTTGVDKAMEGTLEVWHKVITSGSAKFKDVSGTYNSDFFKRNEMLTNTGSTAGAAYLTGGGTAVDDLMVFAQPTATKSIVQQGPGLTIMNLGDSRVKDAAAFLKYFTQASKLEDIAGETGYVPSTKASFADGSSFKSGLNLTKSTGRVISKTLEFLKEGSGYKAFTYPANKYSNAIRDALQAELAAVIKNAGTKTLAALKEEFKSKMIAKKDEIVGAR